jgi:hypothetical protein
MEKYFYHAILKQGKAILYKLKNLKVNVLNHFVVIHRD